jgi:hypothetical protein
MQLTDVYALLNDTAIMLLRAVRLSMRIRVVLLELLFTVMLCRQWLV